MEFRSAGEPGAEEGIGQGPAGLLAAPSEEEDARCAPFGFGFGDGVILFAIFVSDALTRFNLVGDFFGSITSHCLVSLFSFHREPQ